MSRSVESRMEDVRALCRAARDVSARPELAEEIARSTGLSRANVRRALAEHLEVDPTDGELRQLVAHAGHATRVAVILASNVFVGALRAIALALASAENVVVRPSRRDPAFARALVAGVGDARIVLDEAFDVTTLDSGEVHIYGSDETIRDVRSRVRPGVRVVAHGSGLGVAWISANADIAVASRGLAEDIAVFDQRGCLSPRIVLVEGEPSRADVFADALHSELVRMDVEIPRGDLSGDVRAESDRYIAAMTYAGRVLASPGHVVGIAPPASALVSCPAYRHVHVMPVATESDAASVLAPLSAVLIAMGSDDEAAARRLAPKWARISTLGRMQKPPFDGPVDGRSGSPT